MFADAMKNLEPFGQRAQLLRMPSSEAWETEGPLRGVLAQCENDGFTRKFWLNRKTIWLTSSWRGYPIFRIHLDLVKAGFVREFVRGVDVKSVDLLFVDGDHDYNATLNDLKSWSRFVRSGGIISGHDIFNPVNDGVTDAVEDLLRGKNTIVRFATDHVYWWYS